MIEQLFGSKTRVKLLQLFYSNPNRSFYVREITRKIDEQINSVRRELANLLSTGIISSENTNNRLYYEVNQKYDYYKPLSEIFGGGTKKAATSPKLAVAKEDEPIKAIGNVELAVFTGQFTLDDTSGTDILIVGDVNQTKLNNYITELEAKEGKELRYTVLTPENFAYRRSVNDKFLSNIMQAKKQVLVDEKGALSDKSKTEKEEE